MKYFSMFSGIGGFEVGIHNSTEGQWKCVGFSEIDKYAIATYKKHFPNHKNYGNARDIDPKELPDFDLLCGGFPCQSFSIAGKRKGFQDTRGTLFHEICRIVAVKKPRLLFLENVKGLLSADDGRCFATILSSLDELGYDVEWQVLNSKDFGVPQNRERVFIIGHLRGTSSRQVFPIGEKCENNNEKGGDQISSTITSTYSRGWGGGRQMIETGINRIQYDVSGKGYNSQQDRAYFTDGVRCCLPNANPDNKLNVIIPVLTPNRPEKRQNGRRFKDDGEDMFTLTGQDQHGIMIRTHNLQPRSIDWPSYKKAIEAGLPAPGGHGHLSKDDGTSYCLDGANTQAVEYSNKIRRLTPTECERLQGFPDGWTVGSDTQRYKQCGNAVTVNVIEAIAANILLMEHKRKEDVR